MSLYVLMAPHGTFITSDYESAEAFFEHYAHQNVVWQRFDSFEHYIEHRYNELFETETQQVEILEQ